MTCTRNRYSGKIQAEALQLPRDINSSRQFSLASTIGALGSSANWREPSFFPREEKKKEMKYTFLIPFHLSTVLKGAGSPIMKRVYTNFKPCSGISWITNSDTKLCVYRRENLLNNQVRTILCSLDPSLNAHGRVWSASLCLEIMLLEMQ